MKEYKKTVWVLVTAGVMALFAGIGEWMNPVILDGNYLRRQENGKGSYEENLELTVNGVLDSYHYVLSVPEQKLTKTEEEAYLQDAWEEIEKEFPGSNKSPECIRERVQIRDSYQDGKVTAEWSFDDGIMDLDGTVRTEEVPQDGRLVVAAVELHCGESAVCRKFCFQVFPRELSEQQKLLKKVKEELEKQERECGKEKLELPQKIGSYELRWKAEKTYLPVKILLLGVVVAALLPFLEKSRQTEAEKKKNLELEMEYPEIVSRLSILLSSGMTVKKAWSRLAFSYEAKRKRKEVRQMPAYEEMLTACRELESGRGEEAVYERFGERCRQSDYRKLGNLLARNLRKGNRGLTEILTKEAENSFEERKQMAKRYGEEAATKLLFPMLVMLGVILVILVVPAILTFQM